MQQGISRRSLGRASVATLGSFAILRHARGDAPMELRCSLDTAPSHPRNVAFHDYSRQARGGVRRSDQDQAVRERLAVSRPSGVEGAGAEPGGDGVPRHLDNHRLRPRRRFLTASGALRPADRRGASRIRWRRWQVRQWRDHQQAEGRNPGAVVRSRLQRMVLDPQAAQLRCRPERHEAAQPGRRAELIPHPFLRRHCQCDRLARCAAGDVAGHLRRADQQQREHEQRQAVRLRSALFAAGQPGHGTLRADGQSRLLAEDRPKAAGDHDKAVGGQHRHLARQHRSRHSRLAALRWRSRASSLSTCRRPSSMRRTPRW